MTTSHVNFTTHFRFGLELDVTQLKIAATVGDVSSCYPDKLRRSISNISKNLTKSQTLLGKQLSCDHKDSNFSPEMKTIYQRGLGENIIKLQKIDFRIAHHKPPLAYGKKQGFTAEQLKKTISSLSEVKDLLWIIQFAFAVPYRNNTKLQKQLKRTYFSIEKSISKLGANSKNRHGGHKKLFLPSEIERPFLDGSFTDLTPSNTYVVSYLRALIRGDRYRLRLLDEVVSADWGKGVLI